MPVSTDLLTVLKQTNGGRMAKLKLIEVMVAREGAARRAETTAEVERVLLSYADKGRIAIETEKGAEFIRLR
ncbi:MAG: hypothetical protein U1F40_12985 [Turneriella sp.]|nr:hypothetical protein [Turneriella sp.]HNL55666.1 hypothetical protein [Turneriella sp.]